MSTKTRFEKEGSGNSEMALFPQLKWWKVCPPHFKKLLRGLCPKNDYSQLRVGIRGTEKKNIWRERIIITVEAQVSCFSFGVPYKEIQTLWPRVVCNLNSEFSGSWLLWSFTLPNLNICLPDCLLCFVLDGYRRNHQIRCREIDDVKRWHHNLKLLKWRSWPCSKICCMMP